MRAIDKVIFRILRRLQAIDKEQVYTSKNEEDGGPGSGNFGHEGRPGMIGGSGKGGTAYSNGNGSLSNKKDFTSEYKNPHVTDDARKDFQQFVQQRKSAMNMYGGQNAKALTSSGMEIRNEIANRVKLRKKAKDLQEWNKEGEVQTEDIYEVLRDCREFGADTEAAKKSIMPVISDLSKERTDAIVKEALDSIPTDWLENAEFPVEIHIEDTYGRAHYLSERYDARRAGTIFLYAKENPKTVKDLDLPTDRITDMGIANQLRHELGHYIEESNYGIGSLCRDYLEKRTKDSSTEYNYAGEMIKPDKFFTSYMGRQYSDGATEILSCCLQSLGYTDPAKSMTNGMFVDSRDTDSYKFALGLLAFKDGGYF